MINDPISDLLARVRNAALAGRRDVSAPYSKLKHSVADVLKKEGYLEDVKKVDGKLALTLTFKRRKPLITGIRGISRPGLRVYRKAGLLPKPLGNEGISIVSTSQGVMSGKDARKKGLGGEVFGEVW